MSLFIQRLGAHAIAYCLGYGFCEYWGIPEFFPFIASLVLVPSLAWSYNNTSRMANGDGRISFAITLAIVLMYCQSHYVTADVLESITYLAFSLLELYLFILYSCRPISSAIAYNYYIVSAIICLCTSVSICFLRENENIICEERRFSYVRKGIESVVVQLGLYVCTLMVTNVQDCAFAVILLGMVAAALPYAYAVALSAFLVAIAFDTLGKK